MLAEQPGLLPQLLWSYQQLMLACKVGFVVRMCSHHWLFFLQPCEGKVASMPACDVPFLFDAVWLHVHICSSHGPALLAPLMVAVVGIGFASWPSDACCSVL
jgi:hypothetical protein